ncbi:tripartite tricarboxylate transporter substrate binding protein [Orrella sp. JC864]|uniref:Bug family tripartite tricarboxylate transporter substrate binding protein n=1 Tax=Orrella sp. JC864 TaxID=3120298 RepID=UPI003008A239
MMKMTKRVLAACLLGSVGAMAPLAAGAAFPGQPITLVVPFPPGGGNDQIGRLLSEGLAQELKVPVVVENRAGAGGNIGVTYVARARPDGYTLAVASNQVAINTSLYSNLGYDLQSLRGVAMVAEVQFLLVANPATELRSVADVLDKVKAGKTLNHGTPGSGTPQHLSAELFNRQTGISLAHVPYRGSGPAIADVLGGHIELAFATLPAVAPHVKSGKFNGIAVTGKARSPLLPDVPTVAEAGVPGYESTTWYGVLAPAETPDDVVKTLSDALERVTSSQAFQDRLAELGYESLYLPAADMDALMAADEKKWARVINDIGLKIE